MLNRAVSRTWKQLLHPTFRKVALIGFATTLATLIGLTVGLSEVWPEEFKTGWSSIDDWLTWADEAALGLTAILAWYFLFPAISTTIMSLFLEHIAGAVEEEWYPARIGRRPVPLMEALWNGLQFALIVIVLNLIALIPYLILLVLGGIGAPLLFLALNGYLLGREYFEMVALRHMDRRDMVRMRRTSRGPVFIGGLMMAGLFLVPVVNLFAPLVGASVLTHIFHSLVDKYGLPAVTKTEDQTA